MCCCEDCTVGAQKDKQETEQRQDLGLVSKRQDANEPRTATILRIC
jgi:hypothetical protein